MYNRNICLSFSRPLPNFPTWCWSSVGPRTRSSRFQSLADHAPERGGQCRGITSTIHNSCIVARSGPGDTPSPRFAASWTGRVPVERIIPITRETFSCATPIGNHCIGKYLRAHLLHTLYYKTAFTPHL
jgi:hypothetical protein